jgi:3'-phosphoadenosine 5'-phosphosulfate sulfotransferase (PAPS reductase)/FAD synthetase
MNLVLRCNFGDNSIALIQAIFEKIQRTLSCQKVYVVYIDTGWSANGWNLRVEAGQTLAKACGFHPINLKPKARFDELVIDRKQFPSRKFQWCAGFLKGLPFLEWLDEEDPKGEFVIALPKRQALYRTPLAEYIESCEYHGERRVWHPLIHTSHEDCQQLIQNAGFTALNARALECEPCTHMSLAEYQTMSQQDKAKTLALETKVGKQMFTHWPKGAKPVPVSQSLSLDSFNMGCGDPFGCGL